MADRLAIGRWIDAYERAWRAPGTDALADLFTDDATYVSAPFEEPLSGLRAIAAFWDAEREGPGEAFTLRSEIVAVEGDTGVARIDVVYDGPPARRYRDLWIVVLDRDGRCRWFEEWPFFPGQPRAAPTDQR